jgi:hypothetical protein
MISNKNLSVAIMVMPLWLPHAVDCVKDILEALIVKLSLCDKALLHSVSGRSLERLYLA